MMLVIYLFLFIMHVTLSGKKVENKIHYQSEYKGKAIKAFCYIYKEKDETNKGFLTEDAIVFLLKNREYSFSLEHVHSLDIENRYSMFPLIAGGVIVPFTLIAIFKDLYDPWVLIYLFVIGALSFYLGWVGYPIILVKSKGNETDNLKIKSVNEPLKNFLKFVNEVLMRGTDELKAPPIFHIIAKEHWELIKSNHTGKYSPPSLKSEGFIHCSQKEQLPDTIERFFNGQTDLIVLSIDPLKVRAEIKFEPAKDSPGLFPHIYGPLNLDAIIDEKSWLKNN